MRIATLSLLTHFENQKEVEKLLFNLSVGNEDYYVIPFDPF